MTDRSARPARRPLRRTDAVLVVLALLVSSAAAATSYAGAATTPRSASASVSLTPAAVMDGGAMGSLYWAGTNESFSTPAVGNVLGGTQQWVVVGGMDGVVRVFDMAGGLLKTLWTGNGPVEASPVLYDFDHDGKADILVANAGTGDIWVFHGGDFAVMFHVVTNGGPQHLPGVFGTPAVGDLNRNGRLDIVATGFDQQVWAWDFSTGAVLPGFPHWVYDTIWSSPVLSDIDHDGFPEIVFGADMDAYPGAPYPPGGLVWVFRRDGSVQPGWPRSISDQTIWSSPAAVDLLGNGQTAIVVGTGLNFPWPRGRFVNALDAAGNNLPGWPVPVNGAVMASPAIGNLPGGGKAVAVATEGGWVTAIAANGTKLWTGCAATGPCSDPNAPGPLPTHGGVSIADINNDGRPDVVAALDKHITVFDLATGAVEAQTQITFDAANGQPILGGMNFAPGSTPTIVQEAGETRILVSVIFDNNGDGRRDAGDSMRVFEFGTHTALGFADWPTFRQNMQRSGTFLDTTPPTQATVTLSPSGAQASIPANVTWTASDNGPFATGVQAFDVDVSAGGGVWTRWLTGAAPSSRSGASATGGAPFYGLPSHTYLIRATAIDGAGNAGATSTSVNVGFTTGATQTQHFQAGYSTAADGSVGTVASAALPGFAFGGNLSRGVAVLADGSGGYVGDAWGGVHPFGAAAAVSTTGYWPGWDIVRGIALNPDSSNSGYVLDGWGGMHPFGGAAAVSTHSYWAGWDVARGIVLLPSSTKTAPAGYTMDAWGGVHPFGAAPAVAQTAYWPGWPVARGITVDPDAAHAGYVLDAWGGLHPFGGAPNVPVSGYWTGWDITRAVASIHHQGGAPAGYVLDGFGAVHPFGAAPAVPSTYWGRDVAKGVAIAP